MPTMGSQALVRVLPRTRYDFGPLTDATVRFPIAQHIDILGYHQATVQVRIHSGELPAGAQLSVQLADDGFDADDPGAAPLQTATVDGTDIAVLPVGKGTRFPFYQSLSTPIPGVLGRLLAIMVSFTGGPKGGPSVELSVDLVLTGGSVGSTIHQPSTYLGYAHEQVERAESFERILPDQHHRPVGRDDVLASRLSDAILEVLRRANDGGTKVYERFGNVNVGIDSDLGLRDLEPGG
jgi:hypothetical protein